MKYVVSDVYFIKDDLIPCASRHVSSLLEQLEANP